MNKHIEEFLDDYCKSEEDLNYAVLLKGDWGSGKTHFIKSYIEKNENKFKFLHISLYGINLSKELDSLIVFEILKSQKYDKWNILSFFKRIEIPKIKEYFKIKDVEKFALKKFLNKNYVLVFDDLERCSMSIDDTLGYINSFVEFQEQKVILISNEKEIEIKEGKEGRYKHIKEKLIGKTFQITPCFEEALEYFLSKLKHSKCRNFLKKNKKIILSTHNESKYNNIRITIQSLFDFERFYKKIKFEHLKKNFLTQKLLRIFLIIAIENKRNSNFFDDIKKIKEYEILKTKEQQEIPDSDNVIDKYKEFSFYSTILEIKTWKDIINNNLIKQDEINKSLSDYIGFTNESWYKIWHLYSLDQTDDEFENSLQDVVSKLNNKEYKEIGIVLHVLSSLIKYSEMDLYEKNPNEIVNIGKNYIDCLFQEKLLGYDVDRTAWGGLGFPEKKGEFQQIFDYLTEKRKEQKMIDIGEFSKELINKTFLKNPRKFGKIISMNNYHSFKDEPILSRVDSKIFIENFNSLMSSDKRSIILDLLERYKNIDYYKFLIEELNFLKKLKQEAKKRIPKNGKKKLSHCFLESLISEAIEPSIQGLESSEQ